MNSPSMKGRVFGPLKVICRAGVQSKNVSWAYWCRCCGHHGHRLGVRLRRGGNACPACGAKSLSGKAAYPTHDEVKLEAVLEAFGKVAGRTTIPRRRRYPDLSKYADNELDALAQLIDAERLQRGT